MSKRLVIDRDGKLLKHCIRNVGESESGEEVIRCPYCGHEDEIEFCDCCGAMPWCIFCNKCSGEMVLS